MAVTELRLATLLLTALLGSLAIAVPKRWALAPILVASVVLPDDQRIVIAGLDWTMFRLLILCSLARLFVRGEARRIPMVPLDSLLIAFCAVTIVATVFLYGSFSTLVNRLGGAFDILGFYFFCRYALRGSDGLRVCVLVAGLCMIPLALAMVHEWATGRNVFALLGGVPEFTGIREGRLRCQGAFSHPIMAGLFAASWTALFASFSWQRVQPLTVIGAVAAVLVVVLTASSTPLLALLAGIGALTLWRIRDYMRPLRWGILAVLVVLHFVREQPVWHLLARINVVGGSTGWHRFHLIDQAIAHFPEWMLFGTPSTAHWGWGLEDVTNEFIWAGVRGGFLAMVILVAIVSVAFGSVGRAVKEPRLGPELRWTAWCVGAALFVHLVSFFSVAYFGQMIYVWYMHLAMAATVRASAQAARSRPGRDSARRPGPRAVPPPESAPETEPESESPRLGRALVSRRSAGPDRDPV
jgi:hypothetical protein